jgi:hypothetical protein
MRKQEMTVKELIERLQKEDPDRIVIMAKDGEGNSYSPLSDLGTAAYKPTSTWRGDAGLEPEDLTEEMIKKGYSEEDVIRDGQKAIVLQPIN